MSGHRRVAYVEDFYDILNQVHDKDCLHTGSKKTYSRVSSPQMHARVLHDLCRH